MNCGIDIIEISRIEDALQKTAGFLEKVFSTDEIAYYIKNGKKTQHLAGFYAAKEAYSKFKGTGLAGLKLTELSVNHDSKGQPFLTYEGKLQKVSLSISHNKTTAVAVVCGENAVGKYPKLNDDSLTLPKRKNNTNKGDFGKVLVIAGSRGMAGAAAMSAYSALRLGSGLVTLATAECERQVAAGFYPEIMTCGLSSDNGVISKSALKDILNLCRTADSVIFGPGIGKNNDFGDMLEEILKKYTGKLLIDADGINALSKRVDMLHNKSCEVVLTPHPGEMSRLTGLDIERIQSDRQKYAMEFAKNYDVCLVLKGYETVVAKPGEEIYINKTGNPGLATAGTGDVLSGVVGSLMGQGMSVFDAARLGVYIHGLAGDIANEKFGEYSMTATDVIDNLSNALKEVSE